jgi:hypothetical protein
MRLLSSFSDVYDAHLRDPDDPRVWTRETRLVADFDAFKGAEPVVLEPYRAAVQALHEMPAFRTESPSGLGYWRNQVLVVCGQITGFYDVDGVVTAYPPPNEKDVDTAQSLLRRPIRHYPFAERTFHGPKGWALWSEAYQGKVIGPAGHLAADAPLFLVESSRVGVHTRVHANPNLKALGCAKLFTSADLAQRIETYLGNEMAKEHNPVPVRTQVLIRDAHGFDNVSFKNTKPDRRARKQ